jgi:hypothetical protein
VSWDISGSVPAAADAMLFGKDVDQKFTGPEFSRARCVVQEGVA